MIPGRRPRHDGGNSALEMALLGPLLVTVLLMVFEVGYQCAVAAALDYGAQRAARIGITGGATGNGPPATSGQRQTAIRTAVLNFAGGLLADPKLTVTQSSFGSFAAASANLAPSSGPGSAGQVVRYDLTYVQPLLTGPFAASIFGRTEFIHSTSLTVVNEQFPTN